MLSKPTILELQNILREEFGIEYSMESASEAADSLVAYVETLQAIENNHE